jgi:hypothetical protein
MIGAYLNEAITLRRVTSRDEWGKATTFDQAVMARVEWGSKLIVNRTGEQVAAAALVYLKSAAAPTHEDSLVIGGIEYAILKIERKGAFSVSHYEVYINPVGTPAGSIL